MRARRGVLLGAVAAACASTPVGPRLSEIRAPVQTCVDLLLSNTVDLGLSSEQVAALVKLKAELDQQVKPIKEEMAVVRAGPSGKGSSPEEAEVPEEPLPPGGPASQGPPYPPRVGPGRWVGAVRDSGDIGQPGGPRGRHRIDVPPPDYAERRAKLEVLLERYDEADHAAYERAEELLAEAQKATARKLMAARPRSEPPRGPAGR